jgi:hypothetical protein
MNDHAYLAGPRSTFRLNPWVARCVPPAQPSNAAPTTLQRPAPRNLPSPFVNRKQDP